MKTKVITGILLTLFLVSILTFNVGVASSSNGPILFSDDFDEHADHTDPDGWTEVVEDWEVLNQEYSGVGGTGNGFFSYRWA
jgi:hypothetical protein